MKTLNHKFYSQLFSSLCVAFTLVATGCGSSAKSVNALLNNAGTNGTDGSNNGGGGGSGPTVHTAFVVDENNNLSSFGSNAPTSFTPQGQLNASSGLVGTGSEKILSISFGTNTLYALSNENFLYSVDTSVVGSPVATQVSVTGTFSIPSGAKVGMSYNPNSAQLRVTTDSGQNLSLQVDENTQAVTSVNTYALTYAAGSGTGAPQLITSSSSCNCHGLSPTLYGIDIASSKLVTIGTAATPQTDYSTVTSVGTGTIGFSLTGLVTFALPHDSTVAYAAVQGASDLVSSLYEIQLGTGTSTLIGATDRVVQSISIVP